jgi:serine/threonine protein kinase
MSDTWELTGGDMIAPGLTAVSPVGGGTVFEAWLAFDERLHAPVVVKIVRPEHVDDPLSRLGFVREAEMLSRLNHPGIVRMFGFGHGADHWGDRPHLVLENIDGPSLSSLISIYGALPMHQLLPLGLELAAALHYLRGEGICHLDVKPSNIIMGAPAKLIDLSVAMDVQAAAALDHPIGSDEYMAPEQCEPGQRGVVSPASDVWGFGATMFRAAAGYRAFDREPRWAQLRDEPLPLPSTVPPALADIITDCLAVDPDERPEPADIAARIEPLIAALPVPRLSGFSIRR